MKEMLPLLPWFSSIQRRRLFRSCPAPGWVGVCLALSLVFGFGTPAWGADPGQVRAWGRGGWGQTNVPANLDGVVAISAGQYHSQALRQDGIVVAWGGQGSDYQEAGQVPEGLHNVAAISSGDSFSLALLSNGTVRAWGIDSDGQTNVPPDLIDVTAIAAGGYHALALRRGGTVRGWGQNGEGQATPPAGLANVIALAAGSHHSLALKGDGTVVGWGYDGYGQASPPAGLSGVVAIDAVDTRSVALKADGTVVVWGRFSDGIYGVPVGLSNVVAVAAGLWHTLALLGDGTVVAWGDPAWATLPSDLANVVAIDADRDHSLALVRDSASGRAALIAAGSVWRYLDNGADQGTAWREPSYNDSTWLIGPAQLGYGDGDEATVVRFGPNSASKFITTYFRRAFHVQDPAALESLTIRLLRDDGAVVYLNGTAVFVSNMPQLPVTFSTLASTALGSADENMFQTSAVDPGLVMSGRNVMAVEVHQANSSSSDLSFDFELVGTRRPMVAPAITRQPLPSDTVVAGSGILLHVTATGSAPMQYQWQKDGVDLPGQAGPTLTLTGLEESDSGEYRVVVANALGNVTSSATALTVLPASAGPGCAGSLDPGFDAGTGVWPDLAPAAISAITVQPDGKVIIAGAFQEVQGTETASPARLNADGTLDASYVSNPADAAPHTQVVQPDGKTVRIVPGDEENPSRVVRFNPGGAVDGGFSAALPAGFNPRALALQADGKILAAGGVYHVDPRTYVQTVSHPVVRLLSNGALDTAFEIGTVVGLMPGEGTAGEMVAVYDIVQQADGRIFFGGFFTAVNGVRRTVVARLNIDGTLDPSFVPDVEVHPGHDPGIVETVSAMALAPDGKLVVGGFLERINGLTRRTVARLHTDRDGCPGIVRLAEPIVYVGESAGTAVLTVTREANVSGPASVVLATGKYNTHPSLCCFFDYATEGEDYVGQVGVLQFAPGEISKQVTMTILGDDVLESSEHFSLNLEWAVGAADAAVLTTDAASSVVMIHDDESVGVAGSVDTGFQDPGLDGGVSLIALAPDDTVIVGGSFSQGGGGLARFTLTGQLVEDFAPVLDGRVQALAVEPGSGQIIVAGDFRSVNGETRVGLARLEPDGSLDTSFDARLDGAVWQLALMSNGQLVIAGPFGQVAGEGRNGFARLNGDGSIDSTFNAGSGIGTWSSFTRVYDLAVQPDGAVLFCGQFSAVHGAARRALARLNVDGSLDTGFNPTLFGPGDYGLALLLQPDGRILLSGSIRYGLGGIYHIGLVRFLASGAVDSSFLLKTRSTAATMALQPDGKILYGGNTRLNPDGTEDASYFTGSGLGYAGATALVLLPDGDQILGGSFRYVNGFPYGCLARLNGDPPLAEACLLQVVSPGASGQHELILCGGRLGSEYVIEASSDLVEWSTVGRVTKTTERVSFTPPDPPAAARRFYRARLVE